MQIEQKTTAKFTKEQGLSLGREQALFGLAALVMLATRLARLGRWALTERELEAAVSLLGWLRGESVTGLCYSPLQWLLQLPLFALANASELAARLPTALAGEALIGLFYAERQRLGRWKALALSGLVIVSPTWMHFGRQADGALLSAALAVAATILGHRALETGRERDRTWFAVVVAVGLTSGSGFWTWLVAASVALLAGRWAKRPANLRLWRRPLRWAALALIGVSTAGMAHLGGFGASLRLAEDWVSQLVGSGLPWYWPIYCLVLYEPLLLVLGALGAAQAVRTRDGLGLFALGWFAIALVIGLAGHRGPYWLPDVVAPLLLLAASGALRCWAVLQDTGSVGSIVSVMGLLLLLAFLYHSLAMYSQTLQTGFGWLALGALFVIVGLWIGLWLWEGRTMAVSVGLCVVLTMLSAMTLRTATAVAYQTARDPREPLVYDAVILSPKSWYEALSATSLQQARDQRLLGIVWAPDLEVMARWYLREMRFAEPMTAHNWTQAAAILANAPEGRMAPSGYVGQRWLYRAHWSASDLAPPERLRWLLWRTPVGEMETESLALWYRFER